MEAGAGEDIFITPKPTRLIQRMLQIATDEDSVVLDFFAGSGATLHAVLAQNAEDGGNRKGILVQLPEPLETERNEARTIVDLAIERVRRAIRKLNDEASTKLNFSDGAALDRGFRVFQLAESNFTIWDTRMPYDALALAEQLELHVDHTREGRGPADILYEILLKSGYPLTTPVQKTMLDGKTVFSVAEGLFLVCLEQSLTLELIREIGDRHPERVVCLDAGFAGNDQLKANAVQLFESKGIVFKTV